MDRVLLVEPSATRRRAMHTLLAGKGFHVSELSAYAQALPVLERLGTTTSGFRGIVVGWPEHADEHADEVFALLRRDEFEHFGVLLLATGLYRFVERSPVILAESARYRRSS